MNNNVEFGLVEYYYYKFIRAIACSKDPYKVICYLFDNFNINGDVIIGILAIAKLFVIANINCFDDSMKDNMYDFASYLKTIYNDVDDINELIILINNSDDSKMKDLVFLEYKKRFDNKKISSNAVNNLNASIKLLKNMNVMDYNMLITHSTVYDDFTFITKLSDIYVAECLEYMASINMIIKECPELLKNEVFSSRIHYVCDRIYPYIPDKNVKKVYDSFKKNIK